MEVIYVLKKKLLSERTMKPPYYCGHCKNTEAFYGIQRHNRKERNELLYF